MELRHLTYFRRVAELGSFSKAAAVLNMTQPSLSRQIQELERELGQPLFDRTAKGATLTLAGTGLFRHLAVVFAQLERIPEVVLTASQGREPVRIGVPQGMPHEWFLGLLGALQQQLPSASVWLHEATTEEQRQLLQHDLIDLGLLHFDAPEAQSRRILVQDLGIAVAPGSPLADTPGLTFGDLAGLTIMAHAAGEINAEETRLRAASAVAGVETHWVFRRFSEHSSLIAVSSHVDAVLVTRASTARHLPGWRWIPLRSNDAAGERLAIETHLSWREPVRPYLRSVIDALIAAATGGSTEDAGARV